MSCRFLVGDVTERLAEIPDDSVDLIVTSPPFLALRSYLPAGHPAKDREIGSEPDPASFLDTLLGLTAEWGRVLAPHGSIAVELGDTYAGSGGAGGDYGDGGLRDGQERFNGTAAVARAHAVKERTRNPGAGWPLDKSMTLIPTLYPACLAYGRNLLTGAESPAGRWRVRNVIVWARPNPPVGALGDKFRPATSYVTVATRARDRWFDLDAVRSEAPRVDNQRTTSTQYAAPGQPERRTRASDENGARLYSNAAGAPPLDFDDSELLEAADGDWLWRLATAPYKGAHYATFPPKLPGRLIEAMCPRQVCRTCGQPRRRIVGDAEYPRTDTKRVPARLSQRDGERVADKVHQHRSENGANTSVTRQAPTLGWTDCDCPQPDYRAGLVLDPFAGSGTTGAVATGLGRDCILIDLDERNAGLAAERIGMFLEVDQATAARAETEHRFWCEGQGGN